MCSVHHLFITLLFLAALATTNGINGLPDKVNTKDVPLPKDNPLDYARKKGAAVAPPKSTSVQKTIVPAIPPKASSSKTAPAKTGFDESDFITNVNGVEEQDTHGKSLGKPLTSEKTKITASPASAKKKEASPARAVPAVSTTHAVINNPRLGVTPTATPTLDPNDYPHAEEAEADEAYEAPAVVQEASTGKSSTKSLNPAAAAAIAAETEAHPMPVDPGKKLVQVRL